MKNSLRLFLLVLVLAAAAWSACFQVREAESVVVLHLGDPRPPIDEAGLHFKWPAPIATVLRVDRRLRVLDPEPREVLTADKKNLLVACFLAWRVEDPLRFVTSVRDDEAARARLVDLLRAEVGNVLGEHPLAALVSTDAEERAMDAVNEEIARRTRAAASERFGVEIVAARIKRLGFPSQNKEAVFRRMEAERQKIAKEIRSKGREEADALRADATLEAARLRSEAEREAELTKGAGEAEAARIWAEAQAHDPELWEFLGLMDTLREASHDGATYVFPPDHPLMRALEGPARIAPGSPARIAPGGAPGAGGEDGE